MPKRGFAVSVLSLCAGHLSDTPLNKNKGFVQAQGACGQDYAGGQ